MTSEQRRGQRITLAITLLACAPDIATKMFSFFTGRVSPGALLLSLIVPVVTSWLLYRGSRWVRALMIFGFGAGGLLIVIQVVVQFSSLPLGAVVVALIIGGVYLAAAVGLWRSAAVRAYFDRENAPAALDLSAPPSSAP